MTLRPAARLDLRRGESPRRRVDVGRQGATPKVQGGSVRTGDLELIFIRETLWSGVSSSPSLVERPCTSAPPDAAEFILRVPSAKARRVRTRRPCGSILASPLGVENAER
jgi:hypothetical protein